MEPLPGLGCQADRQRIVSEVGLIGRAVVKARVRTPAVVELEIASDRRSCLAGAGARESAQDWRDLLLDLKRRGLAVQPELVIADGARVLESGRRGLASDGSISSRAEPRMKKDYAMLNQ